MKKRSTLQLSIYLKQGKKSFLVFKKEDMICRINNLVDARVFVANDAGQVVMEVFRYAADGSAVPVFNWTDNAENFNMAVRGLCLMHQLGGMCRNGRK